MADQHCIPVKKTDMSTEHDLQGTRHVLPPISSFGHRPTAPLTFRGDYETFTIASDPHSRSANISPCPTDIQHPDHHDPSSEVPSAHSGATSLSGHSGYSAIGPVLLPTSSYCEPTSYRTSTYFAFGPYVSTLQNPAQSGPGPQRDSQYDPLSSNFGSYSSAQFTTSESIFNARNATQHGPGEPSFRSWGSALYTPGPPPIIPPHNPTSASLHPRIKQRDFPRTSMNNQHVFNESSDIAMQDHHESMRKYAEYLQEYPESMREYTETVCEAHNRDLYRLSTTYSNDSLAVSEPIENEYGMSDDDSDGFSRNADDGMSEDDSERMSEDDSDGTLLGDNNDDDHNSAEDEELDGFEKYKLYPISIV